MQNTETPNNCQANNGLPGTLQSMSAIKRCERLSLRTRVGLPLAGGKNSHFLLITQEARAEAVTGKSLGARAAARAGRLPSPARKRHGDVARI